jgi:hypothetical protein
MGVWQTQPPAGADIGGSGELAEQSASGQASWATAICPDPARAPGRGGSNELGPAPGICPPGRPGASRAVFHALTALAASVRLR